MRSINNRRAGFYTLGCKLNYSETSTIARQLEEHGIIRADKGEQADIYIINTCSVTENSDKKCRNTIRKIIRENPKAIVVVTGCYAQLKAHEIASIEGVDLVIGNSEKGSIADMVKSMSGKSGTVIHTCDAEDLTSFFSSFSSGDRTRTFLKIQDGCDYKCSYCTIPLARGGSRNKPITEIIAEAEKIAAKGQKEIVVTGINTGDFGKTTGESLYELISRLDNVEGIERYRISSIEPNLLTDQIIEFCGSSAKFQPHFHIPLQSGCDRILGLMRRRYTTALFADRIEKIRRHIPSAFIGIDVITGFPGEGCEDFNTTFEFLRSVNPAFLHVFPYSVRPNTPAAEFPDKVAPKIIAERVRILTQLSYEFYRKFSEKFIGSEAKVLFESTRRGGFIFGYTENYLKVQVPYSKGLINTIASVRLDAMDGNGNINGSLLQKNSDLYLK
ncbi:MAG: tRNA (N(6)-L-threonylcarbamoyladenosine(37)-C(2))-methylthiotransferase MtaB [Rikenellaceae bacterium]|nr:tRNA (N(6)-L-threonylcarbamoyladenosine(37)-C(2))-methylthiotransferase MtaB [Rikenellaceae bacterium]